MSQDALLEVTDLSTVFNTRDGQVHAVNGVSFSIAEGELLGVVGESGSGKSVTMMSLVRLLPSPPAELVSGTVRFAGEDVLGMGKRQLRELRGGDIGFVFQDPMTSLNPVFTVGFQLVEALRAHKDISKRNARKEAASLLEQVGIPSATSRLRDFPHQFSGGMRQRVGIAMALACEPKLLIADEPTTALDVTIQAQILEVIKKLREDRGMGIIWITHDLGVIAGIADRVLVMYGGQIVEHATVKDLFKNPAHPYTKALLETLPSFSEQPADANNSGGADEGARLKSIEGQPPNLSEVPTSCPFAARCEFAMDKCFSELPPVIKVSDNQEARCWLLTSEDASAHNTVTNNTSSGQVLQ